MPNTPFYSYIDDAHKNMKLPQTRPNGGLYIGEEARGNWGAFPVTPEAHVYHTQNLLSANPPPNVVLQPPAFVRPGNSHVVLPYHKQLPGYNFNAVELS